MACDYIKNRPCTGEPDPMVMMLSIFDSLDLFQYVKSTLIDSDGGNHTHSNTVLKTIKPLIN